MKNALPERFGSDVTAFSKLSIIKRFTNFMFELEP